MKIAVFTDIYAPWGNGGIASSIKAQKDALEKLGHEVVVFCSGNGEVKEKNVILVPCHKHLKFSNTPQAMRPPVIEKFILRKFPDFAKEFDLIHVHYENSCSLAGVRLAKKLKVPLVQTMHGREDMAIAYNIPLGLKTIVAWTLNFLHKKYLPHRKKIKKDQAQAVTWARVKMWELMINHARAADVVIAPSHHFAKKLEHYGVQRSIKVVSNGVNDDLVEMDFKAREMKPGEELKLLWNSRISNEKRIMPFLQAVKLLKRPYILYIYGDGNATTKAKAWAKLWRMNVIFFGERPRREILRKMKEVHLGVMASYNFDTQGMTLLEAKATGLPVFFCDPTMVENVPAGGFVLSLGPDPVSMAVALEELSVEKIAKMSNVMLKHRKDALQSEQIDKIVKIYQDLIKKK